MSQPKDRFTVGADAIAPDGLDPLQPTDPRLARMSELAKEHGGGAEGQLTVWTSAVNVEAVNAVTAVAAGASLIRRLAKQAGLPLWPLARITAVRADAFDHELFSR